MAADALLHAPFEPSVSIASSVPPAATTAIWWSP
jgi:hypothetical protein